MDPHFTCRRANESILLESGVVVGVDGSHLVIDVGSEHHFGETAGQLNDCLLVVLGVLLGSECETRDGDISIVAFRVVQLELPHDDDGVVGLGVHKDLGILASGLRVHSVEQHARNSHVGVTLRLSRLA